MGAWIEMTCFSAHSAHISVAPLVGAWIEIPNSSARNTDNIVAPLVGAWIEISTTPFNSAGGYCRSSRGRSEEHTSELQSRENLVCRLLLEKKKNKKKKKKTRRQELDHM